MKFIVQQYYEKTINYLKSSNESETGFYEDSETIIYDISLLTFEDKEKLDKWLIINSNNEFLLKCIKEFVDSELINERFIKDDYSNNSVMILNILKIH